MSAITYHKHHIIPKHAGGTDDPDNIIRLTIPEHADAHRLLYEQYGRLGDKMAWLMLSGKTEEGELARQELCQTPEYRAKMSAALTGHSTSTIARAKMSISHLGRSLAPETRAKISTTLTGRSASPETRAKMTAAKIGNKCCLGHKLPLEVRAKISATRLRVKHSK